MAGHQTGDDNPLRRSAAPRHPHTLPYQVQWARTGLWDRLEQAGNAIEGARVMKSEMRVVLPNGGVIQAGGMYKPASWRGDYADDITLDEADDTQAAGQATAILPMLADFDGVLVRSGTPKGFGQLEKAYDEAEQEAGHSRYLLHWWKTDTLSADTIAGFKSEMTPEEFAQEIECSFEAPNSGAYSAADLQRATNDGRIGVVPYDPGLPCGRHGIWAWATAPRSGSCRCRRAVSCVGSATTKRVASALKAMPASWRARAACMPGKSCRMTSDGEH